MLTIIKKEKPGFCHGFLLGVLKLKLALRNPAIMDHSQVLLGMLFKHSIYSWDNKARRSLDWVLGGHGLFPSAGTRVPKTCGCGSWGHGQQSDLMIIGVLSNLHRINTTLWFWDTASASPVLRQFCPSLAGGSGWMGKCVHCPGFFSDTHPCVASLSGTLVCSGLS